MALTLTNAMPTSFKVEILKAVHNFSNPGGNTFKLALFVASATGAGTFGAGTTNYSQMGTDELPDATGGYTRPGKTLTSVTPTSSSTTAFTDFDDVTWSAATFTTSGALLYNSSASGAACAVLSFGGDQSVSSGDFSVQFPAAAAATAIIRIA